MANYESWSLREIKTAMTDAYHRIHEMNSLYETYADAANSLDTAAESMHSARSLMRDGWKGPAADSASSAVSKMVDYTHHSRNSSAHMGHLTDHLARSTSYHHDKVEGVPDEDTSMWASMQSTYMNPFMAMPDHNARVYRATKNQQTAAAHARALDQASGDSQHQMNQVNWPNKRKKTVSSPPRGLPVRHHSTPNPPVGPTPPSPPPPPPVTPTPTPPVPPGPYRPHGPQSPAPPTVTAASTAPAAAAPTVGSGGGASAPGFAGPSGVGDGGLGTASGLLAGGNALAGVDGLGAGSGLGESGRVPLEPGNRAGVSETDGAARGSGSTGVGEEGVPGERGFMGAPMGGAGGRRRDDEESRRPDYLEEDEDVWAMSSDGVPPVLGEEGQW